MNEIILEEKIAVNEFLDVVEAVGFRTYSHEQVEKALKNLFVTDLKKVYLKKVMRYT